MPEVLQGRVSAVCVGKIGELTSGRRRIRSAFVKGPVEGRVRLTSLGFEGDQHVYEDHGGEDLAVLAYSLDNYPYWRGLGIDLPDAGAFGENLTVTGLTEAEVRLGDVFEAGSSVMQVTQPRAPCYKIATRYGRKDMSVLVQETGFSGYLMRVLTEGDVAAGDAVTLVERDTSHTVTVAEAGRIVNVDRNDHEGAQRLLGVDALSPPIKRTLEARIASRAQLGLEVERLFLPDHDDA